MPTNSKSVINYNLKLTNLARNNRKNLGEPERKIWREVLRNKQTGYKFLRQKPIGNYVLDFYSSELLLADVMKNVEGVHKDVKKQIIDRKKELNF